MAGIKYLGDVYFDGSHDNEQVGPLAVVCSHGVDGNLFDVYGETVEDAESTANRIVSILNWTQEPDNIEKFAIQNGGVSLFTSWCRQYQGMDVTEALEEWHRIPTAAQAKWCKVAQELLEDFTDFIVSHDIEGNHLE